MHAKIVSLMILTVLAGFARADEKFPLLQAGSQVYTNVNITKVGATDIFFTHAGGMANVKLKTLSPELQKHFNYDPQKARAVEQKKADDNAAYQKQLAQQPAVRPPDMSRPPAAPTTRAVWRNDFAGALKQAKSENKLVLLDFTGSDWCGWCMKFEKDVLSTPKFSAYADSKLQLVRLDYPHHTPQPEALRQANAALSDQFHVDGFPTFVLVNADGKELGRQVGYLEGGPDAFIAELESFNR